MSEAAIIEFPQDGRPFDISPEEWQARCELAAAYRLCHLYGWTDLNNTISRCVCRVRRIISC